jgi:predicted MFS family arabinose efflux permease
MNTDSRERILTRPMIMAMATTFGALTSFYLLVSVVPLYAAGAGTGGGGVGLSTGAMMLSTVMVEFAVPRLLARFGCRAVIAAGLVLLGVPAIALLASAALPVVLGVSFARGAGLGILMVAGTALAADLVPAGRRGEGMGLYGVAAGVPSIAGLPLGLWISHHFGYGPVFVAGTAVALVPLLAAAGLPSTRPAPDGHDDGILRGLRVGGIARPALIFSATTLAAGVIMTFLPLAVPARAVGMVSMALLVQSIAMPLARWWAGRFGDRHGHSRLLLPGVLASAIGTAGLFWLNSPYAVIGGMALFGIGFGIAQNVTQSLMFARVPRSEFGRVSALWNLAYDGGLGVGAVGFGLVLGHTGYAAGFALTAALIFATLVPALRDLAPTARPRALSPCPAA